MGINVFLDGLLPHTKLPVWFPCTFCPPTIDNQKQQTLSLAVLSREEYDLVTEQISLPFNSVPSRQLDYQFQSINTITVSLTHYSSIFSTWQHTKMWQTTLHICVKFHACMHLHGNNRCYSSSLHDAFHLYNCLVISNIVHGKI